MILLFVLAGILFGVGVYIAYIFISFNRIPDYEELNIEIADSEGKNQVPINQELSAMSYNIGFGAYEKDYSFFMDDGKYSRAFSKERLLTNLNNIFKRLGNETFTLIQEVDFGSTRSYKIDETALIKNQNRFKTFNKTFAINYDSPYLLYPFNSPIGKSKSGLMTLSSYKINRAVRRSLPIQEGIGKFLDLDRCYSVNRIETTNNKELILVNLHLSAYTTDKTLSDRQISMLFEELQDEYKKGNYVIAGGDFNKDFLGYSGDFFTSDGHKHSGVTAFPYNLVPEGFMVKYPYDENNRVATCRNAHESYKKDSTYVQTIDGFIISNNILFKNIEVIDTDFENSDHNPVVIHFELLGA